MTGLPEALPNPAAIDDAAWDVRSVGVYSDSIRDEVQGEWKNLGAVFKSPHQDRVYSAVTKVMGPYIDATMALTDDAAKALEAFADDMTALRSRFENIRSRAATHNAVPFVDQDTEYWQDNTEVQNEVDAVAGLYDAAVDRCASALRKLNPSMPGGLETAATVAGKMGDGKELLKAAGLGASHFTFRDGKLFFSFTQTSTPGQPVNPNRFRINAFVLERLGVPSSYLERLHASQGPDLVRVSNNATRAMLGDVYRTSTSGDLPPTSMLGKLVARYPWLRNTKLNTTGNDLSFSTQLTRGPGAPPGTSGLANGSPGILRPLEKAEAFLKGPAGKVLAVAGPALTFAGSYSEGYNSSVLRNPEMSEAEHHGNAVVDAGTVAVASEIGSVVGTGVGRLAGGAIGQALIPIPGVGAAVGGFVGGLVGGWVGGNVGGAVGGLVNDMRHGDKSFGAAVGDAGMNLLKSFNPFG
ncbi:hypothetical protein [Paeniglutamicibacter cryotolerans]|nr:hypothetical protein [Paeniglutamicibacter cryotolerans]